MEETNSNKEEPKKNNGKVISIIGFILVIVYLFLSLIKFLIGSTAPISLIMPAGAILGIIGWVKSKRSGKTNPLAIITVILAVLIYGISIILGTYLRMQYQY